MKPAPFDYLRPDSIEAACAVLAEAGGGAQILAGGQTLMPLLALRMSQPFILVDITRIAALKGIACTPEGTRIGPATRQNEALGHAALAEALPVLVTALRHVGHHQTRNRGTIGGSIALGEPAAEMPATALALGARLELRSVRGTRAVAARDFYTGPYATVMEPDEMLTSITYSAWPAQTITVFRELARRPGDFALTGLTGALVVEQNRITRAGLAWFGMGPTPLPATQTEAALLGQDIARLDVQALAELAISETAPFDDHHASAEYRRAAGRRMFARALGEALDVRQAG